MKNKEQGEEQAQKTKKLQNLGVALVVWTLLDYFILRQPLYDISIPILQNMRNVQATKNGDLFFKIVSELGDKYALSLIFMWAASVMSLEKTFIIALDSYTALAVLSILKSIIHEPRPFHIADIQPSRCWLEYGNPSGHSLLTSSVYMTMWAMSMKEQNLTRGVKYNLTRMLAIGMCLLVSFSRIYHGVHTLNQLLNGWVWGYALYYFFTDIQYEELVRFFFKIPTLSNYQLAWNKGTKIFYSCYILATLLWVVGTVLNPMPEAWLANIEKNCGSTLKKNDVIDPESQNFEKFNMALSIIGVYIGLIIEARYFGTHVYQDYYKTSWKQTIMRVVICFTIGFPLISGILISKHNNPYWYVVIFRNMMPPTMGNLYMFGAVKYISMKIGTSNNKITQMDSKVKTK